MSGTSSSATSSTAYHALPHRDGSLRGIQRGQKGMVVATLLFIALSTVFSVFPRGGRPLDSAGGKAGPPLTGNSPWNGLPIQQPASPELIAEVSAGTSAKALSWAERNDRTWPDDKCRREFPLLYPQLEELVNYWQQRGGLNQSVVDSNEQQASQRWGHTRVIIRDGQIFVRSFQEGDETRNSALIQLLSHAIASWPTSKVTRSGVVEDRLPPIDLVLSPGDKDNFPSSGGWTVTKKISDGSQNGTWLIPDFGFVGWPEAGAVSYEEFLGLAAMVEKEFPWEKKHDRFFWRGFPNWYPIRNNLMELTSTTIEPKRESWADVHKTTFHTGDVGDFVPLVTLPDHCQHKYLVHTEGNSYSGRSKYLFSCRSVTVAHPLEWTQHFHPALNPYPESNNQNYVQLPGPGFEGIEQAALELREADSGRWYTHSYKGRKAPEKIAQNAIRTLRDRYLTPAATMCYTRAALRHYSSALNASSWGPHGPELLPGQGVGPGASKGRPMSHLKGDIEAGVWRLLGGPNWPPLGAPQPGAQSAKAKAGAPEAKQKVQAAIVE